MNRSAFQFPETIVFVTPDPLLALGLVESISPLAVLCVDNHPVISFLRDRGVVVWCAQEQDDVSEVFRSSRHLLQIPAAQRFLEQYPTPLRLLFFLYNFSLPTLPEVSEAVRSLSVLNPPFEVNRLFEDKISFPKQVPHEWIPPFQLDSFSSLSYGALAQELGERLVLQWGTGWAGNSTLFIEGAADWEHARTLLPSEQALVRVSRRVEGKTITVNSCVTPHEVMSGTPFLQLTGIPELTPYPGGTCGNVWGMMPFLDGSQRIIRERIQELGVAMRRAGFLGHFGTDWVWDIENHRAYLLEINARLTASVPLASQLEWEGGLTPLVAHHCAAFFGHSLPHVEQQSSFQASQIVVRSLNEDSYTLTRSVQGILGHHAPSKTPSPFMLGEIPGDATLLLSQAKGHIVTVGGEIGRLQSRTPLADFGGVLTPHGLDALHHFHELIG